ncbi:MAG: xanthine dehydrogenase family protein subunit M [Chitinophagaceae bacterium]
MNPFEYIRPGNQKAAINALAKDPAAIFIAGGTNLVDLMKRGVATPQKLIDINNLPLKTIESKNGILRIGSLSLNSNVAMHDLVTQTQPLLSLALKAGASPQLRNMATVGGNIMQRTRCPYFYDTVMPCNKRAPGTGCGALKGYNRMHAIFGASEQCIAVHPSDMCVALAALDATVVVSGLKGERRFAFIDFHRLPGEQPEKDNILDRTELITAVEIPDGPFTKHVHYLKVRDRSSYAFALVSVAAALDIRGGIIQSARLAMGGVAHKPWRLFNAEKALAGKPVSETSFRQVAQLAMKDARAFEHNTFKLTLAPNAIAEALKMAAGKS